MMNSLSQHDTELTPRRRTLILVTIGLALMMVVSAVSGLNVALPDLARDTGASQSQVQWIVNAYTMVFAGLLLAAGAAGDRFGRRGILTAGLVVFGLGAFAGMFVEDPTTLILLRAAMGVGAACVMPATLSIITTSFPEQEKAKAVGVWVGIAGGGAVLGLLASGALLELFSWSSFFGLNVTLAVMALVGTRLVVPDSRDPEAAPIDTGGALLSLVGVTALVFGIIEGPERGWGDPAVLTALVAGIGTLAGFVAWELRQEEPLLDPRLFALRGFGAGSLTLTVQFFASFGFFYLATQYLQYVAGLSPLESALALMPLPAVLIPLSRLSPGLADRFGANRVTSLGLVLIAAGLTTMALTLDVDLTYWHFAAGLIVFAAGAGLAATPATTAIVSSLPPAKQGVASAVNDVSREFGSALGIAILGSVLNSAYRSGVGDATAGLPDAVGERARESVSFVGQGRLEQFGAAGARLEEGAVQAFVDAASSSLLVAAGVGLVAAVFVLRRAPAHPVPPVQEPQPLPSGDARALRAGT